MERTIQACLVVVLCSAIFCLTGAGFFIWQSVPVIYRITGVVDQQSALMNDIGKALGQVAQEHVNLKSRVSALEDWRTKEFSQPETEETPKDPN